MRVWNKQLLDLTGKDVFKLYLLYQVYRNLDDEFGKTKTYRDIRNWIDKREAQRKSVQHSQVEQAL